MEYFYNYIPSNSAVQRQTDIMQLTMGRSANDHRASMPARQAVPKSDPFRPSNARQQRHSKSQPFDADDLRRRLYIVIAEQEAQKKRQKRRPDESYQSQEQSRSISRSEARQTDAIKPGASEKSFATRMAKSKVTIADSTRENDAQPPKIKTGRSMSKSIQDRLRRRPSEVDPTATESAVKTTSYQHVPQEAAAQFERTATANSMRDRNLEHSISQSTLKYQVERRPSDQHDLESSTSPTQQNHHTLERVRSKRELFHERNPFQTPQWHPSTVNALADTEELYPHPHSHQPQPQPQQQLRRHSAPLVLPPRPWRKNSIGTVLEDKATDEISSEETLVVVDPVLLATTTTTIINEHRVDWTQSDEKPVKSSSGTGATGGGRIPLLRKADSLWTLKKLGGLIGVVFLARNSSNSNNSRTVGVRRLRRRRRRRRR
ncbi:hypothetical protein GL218_00780 [Daldinia childiae]|uniref:uncharacterized protein n=1 Tax=Daldinia childiae TaxID=326645 RepID=UPI0014478886|nr:uncharacterized protein GL218_00780 [Daldinia childiae]KAF3070707.1 hypothetical protein GL218_00780 [Daldinia childiae]